MGTGTGIRKAGAAAALASTLLLCLLAAVPREAQATYPGRPGLIVFNHIPERDEGGYYIGGLYAMRPEWKNPRRLTDNAWDDEASFAPSGQRLVFRRSFESEVGIHTLDVGSGRTMRLTEQWTDRAPAFGRRGRIVFSRLSPLSGSYDLFLRTPAGRLRRLTSTPADDIDAVFTPDGSKILFAQDHLGDYPSDQPPPPPRKISSIRVDGTGLRDVKGLEGAGSFDVSPDGRDLIFQWSGPSESGDRFGIWTREIDGGRPRLIAEDGLIPAYSPSGDQIVYSMLRKIWLVSTEGRGKPKLLRDWDAVGHTLEDKLTTEPAWQPLPRPSGR